MMDRRDRALRLAQQAIAELTAEVAALRLDVIAFCAPWAVNYAKDNGFPPSHLHPKHYDILERCGARMDDFVRGEIQ